MDNEINQVQSEEPNLFGAMSSIGFQIYGYVLAQNAGRAASNYERMAKHSDKLDDVFLHMNIPFTGRFDKGGFGSISKAYNGLKASDDTIVSAFKSNNYHFFSQLENSGFSKDDVKKLKKFASLSSKDSYFKTYSGASEYVKDSDNIVENILNTKKKYSSSKSTPAGKPNTAPKTSVVNPKEVFSNETTPFPSIVEEKSPVVSSPQFEKISTEKPVKKGVVSSPQFEKISTSEPRTVETIPKTSNPPSHSEKVVSDVKNFSKNTVPSDHPMYDHLKKIEPLEAEAVPKTSKKAVDFDEIRNILNKTDDSGELLIKKVSPNISQTSTKGVGFAFNLTKFAEKMPTFSKYLFAGARVAAGVADGLIIYDLVKTTGEIAINTYKNTDSYKDKEDRKFMAINHIKSYDQMASFEDRVLSSRISSNQTIQEERSLIQTALNAKSNVNEVLRQSIGGYSVNELSVNKVRKSGR